uniref:RanBP2-type domain-containing protein n=1 Tax=Plectus sambesii TaxID=2011161 RepID=A0A914VRE7_9BILA
MRHRALPPAMVLIKKNWSSPTATKREPQSLPDRLFPVAANRTRQILIRTTLELDQRFEQVLEHRSTIKRTQTSQSGIPLANTAVIERGCKKSVSTPPMTGMHSQTSSSSDSTRSILYSTLMEQFPEVSSEEIIAIIHKYGHDAALCRQLVQDASSRSNPVFVRLHNLPTQPGADGYRWPGTTTPPQTVSLQRPRATNDSGIHTLSPTPNLASQLSTSPSISPSSSFRTPPSPTSSAGSGTGNNSGKQSRSLLNKVGKHLGFSRKNAPSIFVPAPLPNNSTSTPPAAVTPPSSNGLRAPPSASPSTSSPSSPTPPPRRLHPPHSGSLLNLSDSSSANESGDALGGRRPSAPARPPPPNNHSRSFVPMAHLSAQRIHFERLKGVLDANKVLQKELERDVEALASFKLIHLPQMNVEINASPDEINALKRESTVIQNDIDELRRKIASYERLSGIEQPPELPPKPHARASSSRSTSEEWACLQCTYLNHSEMPRCEVCLLPRIVPKLSNDAVAVVAGSNASGSAASCYCCNSSNSSNSMRQSSDRSPYVETERLVGMAPAPEQEMEPTDGGDSGWVMVDVIMGPAPPFTATTHM